MKALRTVLSTVLAAVAPFALWEAGLRLAGWHPSKDWYFFGVEEMPPVLRRAGGMLEVQPHLRGIFRAASFPEDRAPGEIRLVALGDSVTWGHRSNDDPLPLHAWPDALQDLLRTRPGGGSDRVINLAARTWASLRVLRLLPQALALRPDAVLASFGSSEFLEESIRREVEAWRRRGPLWRLRFVQWLEQGMARARGEPSRHGLSARGLAERDDRLEAPFLAAGQPFSIPERRRLLAEVETRLEEMARQCEAAGLPLVILTVPANLRWPPEGSLYPDGKVREVLGEAIARSGRMINEGRAADARALLEPLAEQYSDVAALWFRLAQACEGTGDLPKARRYYEKARDLAAFPLRALEPFNNAIRDLARRHRGVILVDAERILRESIPDGIPDDRLFLDQNHPDEATHRRIAQEVLDVLRVAGIVPATSPLLGDAR